MARVNNVIDDLREAADNVNTEVDEDLEAIVFTTTRR